MWNPWGALAAVAGLATMVVGVIVLLGRPDRFQNRVLSLVLIGEGFGWFLHSGVQYTTGDPAVAWATQLATAVMYLLIALYLWFVGTLDSPLARPLGSAPVRATLLAFAALLGAWVVLVPEDHITGVWRAPWATWEVSLGVSYQVIGWLQTIPYLYATIVAFSQWRRAPMGSTRRAQGLLFAIAFGIKDGMFILIGAAIYAGVWFDAPWIYLILAGMPLALIATSAILAYGVLRHQMFDIDIKIKSGISRGTLVGSFLAVFFIVGVIAENWLTDRFGLALGGVAAGLLLFALNPLQRFADRVSDAAMPNVRDDDEYRLVRKRDVYLAALEGAFADGAVSDRERDMLVRLQDQLGLSATEARSLETALAERVEVGP